MSSGDASRYVKFLFSFPSLRVIIFINLFLETIILIFLLYSCPILRAAPQISILIFSPLLCSMFVHKIFFQGDRIFTFRRLLALQSVQEFIFALLFFVGWIFTLTLNQNSCFTAFFLTSLGIALSSFITTLVMLGFLRKSIHIVFVISLLHLFLQSSRWLVLSLIAMKKWVNIILPLVISFSTSILFLFIISIKWKKNAPISPLKIFQAYLEYYLNKNSEPFENVLEEICEEKNLELSLLLFTLEDGTNLSIFGLSAHFGPFGTVGSSSLPSRLINELEDSSLRMLLLRNLSDHSFNLSSWRVVEKIKKEMIEALNSAKYLEDYRANVIQKEAEGYCVTLLRIFSYCIVLLSCPGHSMEDLPPRWFPLFSSVVSRYGFIPLIIIDAHNSIDPSSWKVSDPDEETFARLLNNALECLQKSSPKSFKIGFDRIRPAILPKEEIGPGGISTLVFKAEDENHAIVVIDGNNMVAGLRNYLVENLKNLLNLSTLEIVTTDTHLLTGIRKAKRGYFPIGFKTRREILLEYCVKSINNAIGSLSSYSAKAWVGKVNGVKVTGGIFKIIENFVEFCEKLIYILIISTILLTFLLLLSFF
ncbi:MAG: DUF2070 family protein [Thermoproteota archaeon]